MTDRHRNHSRPAAPLPESGGQRTAPHPDVFDAGSQRAWAHRLPWLAPILDLVIVVLLAVLVAGVDPAGVPIHAIFAVLVVRAFAIDLWGTVVRLVGVMAILTAMLVRGALVDPDDGTDLLEWLLLCALVPLIAVLAERRERATRRFGALYHDAATRLVTGEEELRRQVARDLHDGVGQGLGALMLTIDLLGARVASDEASASLVERSRRLAETVLGEVEAVVSRLHPALAHENGLTAAIGEMAELAAIPVELSIDPDTDLDRLSPAAQTSLFRIIQEALANAARHGHASRARVEIVCAGDALRATIADDGVGFVPGRARGRGLGLVGMEDRATSVGGRLVVTSQPERGTVVSFELPLREVGPAPGPTSDGQRDPAAPDTGLFVAVSPAVAATRPPP